MVTCPINIEFRLPNQHCKKETRKMGKYNEKVNFKMLERLISPEYIYWQAELLNCETCSTRFQRYRKMFKERKLDYISLYSSMVEDWLSVKEEEVVLEKLGVPLVFKYGLEPTEEFLWQVRAEIQDCYSEELCQRVLEVMMELAETSHQSKGKNIGNSFALIGNFSELLRAEHPVTEEEYSKFVDFGKEGKKEEKSDQKKKGSGRKKKNHKSTKKGVKDNRVVYLDLYRIPLVLQVLLFTCLSKSGVWPNIMRTKVKNGKRSKVDYLVQWFKGFKEHYTKYIKCSQDMFHMSNKELRNLQKKIWKREESQNNPYSTIFDLAWEAKFEEVRQLLLKGLDVNSRNGKKANTTLLHIAAEKNYIELANMLEMFRADPNVRDEIGMTPIFYAVERKNHEMIELLIKMGANVNATDKFESSVFYCAIYSSDVKSLEILKRNGAKIHCVNKIQRTPLIKAAYLDKPDAVEWLLQFEEIRKTMNVKDNRGRGAIHAACWGPKGGREGKKNSGRIVSDSPRSLELLLNAGADVRTTKSNFYFSPPVFSLVHLFSFNLIEFTELYF